MSVGAYEYGSLNVTLGVNLSVTVFLDVEFGPGASANVYSKGEGCIDLYVVDYENHRKWLNKEGYETYLTVSGAHSSSFMFQTSNVNKNYYFILDNSWRCSEKIVDMRITASSKPVFGGPLFQIAGLGLLSVGSLLAMYGLVKEEAPVSRRDVEGKGEDFDK
ncbi:MAG: hypothetical protein JTT11_03580 [Candidatus Brockarchaeota archaeon]|nr:hypothetical protein [Candidatus Brockarchaeota archaeon]